MAPAQPPNVPWEQTVPLDAASPAPAALEDALRAYLEVHTGRLPWRSRVRPVEVGPLAGRYAGVDDDPYDWSEWGRPPVERFAAHLAPAPRTCGAVWDALVQVLWGDEAAATDILRSLGYRVVQGHVVRGS